MTQTSTRNIFGFAAFIVFVLLFIVGTVAVLLAILAERDGGTMGAGMILVGVLQVFIFIAPIGVASGAIGLTRKPKKLAAIGVVGNTCLVLIALST